MKLKKFCINLERRPDRRATMERSFKENSIDDVEFFNAIDGNSISATEEIMKIFLFNEFNYRAGVIGCALSHYHLLKQLANGKTDQFDTYMIMEDDVIFRPEFNEKFNALTSLLPDNFQICYFGHGNKFQKDEPTLRIVDNVATYGTFGYIVQRSFAIKIVEAIETHGIRAPIDVFLERFCANEQIRSKYVYPPLIDSLGLVDTNIQTDFSQINGLDEYKHMQNYYDIETVTSIYKFIPNIDFNGNDLENKQGIPLKRLARYADEDKSCVAFNTNGYMKRFLMNPIIVRNTYKRVGTYVKVVK